MSDWKFTRKIKKHTQDGPCLVQLMKGIGKGKRPVLAVDIGCGDGIIAYDILKFHKATHVIAIDVQKEAVDVASKNLEKEIENRKAEVFRKTASSFFKDKKNASCFDRFVINPPFFPQGSGPSNKNSKDQMARFEKTLSLKNWVRGARQLLKTGGDLYCVFPTERLAELLHILRESHVEPKEIWWLKEDLRHRRFFLRAMRGAKPGLIVHFDFALKA